MLRDVFDRFAGRSSERAGSPWAFGLAVSVLVLWAVSGPVDIEDLDDEELEHLHARFRELAERAPRVGQELGPHADALSAGVARDVEAPNGERARA